MWTRPVTGTVTGIPLLVYILYPVTDILYSVNTGILYPATDILQNLFLQNVLYINLNTRVHARTQGFYTHPHASIFLLHNFIWWLFIQVFPWNQTSLPNARSLSPSLNYHPWHQYVKKKKSYFESRISQNACSAADLIFNRVSVLVCSRAVQHLPKETRLASCFAMRCHAANFPYRTSYVQSLESAETFFQNFVFCTIKKFGMAFEDAIEDANMLSFWCKKYDWVDTLKAWVIVLLKSPRNLVTHFEQPSGAPSSKNPQRS